MNTILKNKSNNGEAKNMKKKKGFTLIELIAVIAILGILAVVLVPNIIGYTNKAKISKAQSDAGIIIRAIDAYEAETSEAVPSTTLVTQSATGGNQRESIMDLATLFTADTAGVIFGPEAPVKVFPKEFTASGTGTGNKAVVTISKLRDIADRTMTISVDNANGGRVTSASGITY